MTLATRRNHGQISGPCPTSRTGSPPRSPTATTSSGSSVSGGMATVYLAEDLKHHRKVAVKVLRPELAATLGPERFLREIEIAARLQHPHILPLHDSGEADGFLYYVMPFVDGENAPRAARPARASCRSTRR